MDEPGYAEENEQGSEQNIGQITNPVTATQTQALSENNTQRYSTSILNRSDEDIFINATPTTVTMSCPVEKVGMLIGKKGTIVQEIMRRSTCRIYVDQNFPENQPRQIQVTGHPKDLSIAIALVSMVMDYGPSIISPVAFLGGKDSSGAEGTAENIDSDFICPSSKVGALIGSKGSNVAEILNRTGCKVQVLPETFPDADRRVIFSGTTQQIQEAKVLVNQLVTNGVFDDPKLVSSGEQSSYPSSDNPAGNNQQLPGTRTQEFDIFPDKVRLVIGSKGVTIGEIMKRSGCKVYINQNFGEGHMHRVVYTGTPQQIDIAKYLVEIVIFHGMTALYSVLNGGESLVIQEVSLFESQAAKLTNEVLGNIQAHCSVKINVDNASAPATGAYPEKMVRTSIIGKLESVHLAIKLIYQTIGFPASLEPQPSNAEMSSSPQSFQASRPSSGPILALGKDGTCGHLESAYALPDGSHQQVAEINNEAMGRVVGARSATIVLIQSKSGASLHVLKTDHTKGSTRIVLSGTSQAVALAAQMVQEVLVNGTGKLLKMPDAIIGPKGLIPSPNMALPQQDHAGYFGAQQQQHIPQSHQMGSAHGASYYLNPNAPMYPHHIPQKGTPPQYGGRY